MIFVKVGGEGGFCMAGFEVGEKTSKGKRVRLDLPYSTVCKE